MALTWPEMVKGIVRSSKPLSVHFADGVYKRAGEMTRLLHCIAKEHAPKPQRNVSLNSAQVLSSEISPILGLAQSQQLNTNNLGTTGGRPHQ